MTKRWSSGEHLSQGKNFPARTQLMIEELFLGLRSTGLDLCGFRSRHREHVPPGFEERLEAIVHSDLATSDGERVRLTTKGYVICDELCASLAASSGSFVEPQETMHL